MLHRSLSFLLILAVITPTLLAHMSEASSETAGAQTFDDRPTQRYELADVIGQDSDSYLIQYNGAADSYAVEYYNAAYWQAEDNPLPSLEELRDQVINQHLRIFVDFSQISDTERQAEMQAQFSKSYGVGFDNAHIVITEHKGEVMFVPADYAEAINPKLLEVPRTLPVQRKGAANTLPHVAFYISVNRAISDEECTFHNSWLWKDEKGSRSFCKDAHISLIYRVNLERSLQYGTVGSATPDAKIVRISLDDESAGAGIHLNDNLSHRRYGASYTVLDGYFREWSTDAIAQDYRFEFNAENNKAEVLKTFPAGNINANFTHREESGFELGVSGGVEVDKNGPKGKLEASASYTQSRWLSYDTQDYGIQRSTQNPQNVSFTWSRQQYATAESLHDRSTDAIWVNTYPVDVGRISPLSYTSFVPKMDVIYKASPTETGITDFMIASSVNIRPIYSAAYSHYYVLGAHQSYHGFDEGYRRRITAWEHFTVNWDHPVFSGGQPVNLQLGSFNNRCIEVGAQGSLTANTCDSQQVAQSFIYDQLGRYVSASDAKLCLDSEALDALQTCNQNLTQRWVWSEGADELRNLYTGGALGHDKQTGELGLDFTSSDAVSLRTVTAYTDLFDANVDVDVDVDVKSSPLFGFGEGKMSLRRVGQGNRLYARTGDLIDALGLAPELLVGGPGGSLNTIDLSGVKSITAKTINHLKLFIALTFTYQDGSQLTIGQEECTSAFYCEFSELAHHKEHFDLPDGANITKVKIWADDHSVHGVIFDFN